MSQELRASIIAGASAGMVAALAFLVLHAMVIVPIWGSIGTGLAVMGLVGAILGAMLHSFLRPHFASIGLFLFGAVALATLVDLSTNGPEWIDIILVTVAAVAYGGYIGYHTRGTLRAVSAGAAASVTMVMGAAGPVNLATERGLHLFLGLLPVTILFGAVYVLLFDLTARCRDSSPLSPPA